MSVDSNSLTLSGPATLGLGGPAPRQSRQAGCRSIRSPLMLVGVFALGLIALVWDGVYVQSEGVHEFAVERARRDNANLARAFAEHSERILEGADQALLFLKRQYEKSGGRLEAVEHAHDVVIPGQVFSQIGLIDENGVHQAGNLADSRRAARSAREHLAAHAARDTGTLLVSRPMPGDAAGQWSLQLSRRINRRDGGFAGVVVISVDSSRFSRVYGELDLGPHGMAALVGADGIVRARLAGGDLAIGQDIGGSLLAEHMQVGDSGSFLASLATNTPSRLVSYHKLSAYPLAVAVGQSEQAVLAPLRGLERNAIGRSALISLALLVIAVIAGYQVRMAHVPRRAA